MSTDGEGEGVTTTQPEEAAGTALQPAATESLTDRWIDLFPADDAPDLQPQMFDDALGELATLVQARPDVKDETILILERHFASGLDKVTWSEVTRSLTTFCGTGPAYLINWLVYGNTEGRLAAMDTRASAEVVGYLRSVVTRFWNELNCIQLSVSSSTQDWGKVDKWVYYDNLSGRFRCNIDVTKVNGDVVTLEMTPDSLLNFTRHLLIMVSAVGNRDDFSQERVSAFLEQLGPVVGMLSPQQPA